MRLRLQPRRVSTSCLFQDCYSLPYVLQGGSPQPSPFTYQLSTAHFCGCDYSAILTLCMPHWGAPLSSSQLLSPGQKGNPLQGLGPERISSQVSQHLYVFQRPNSTWRRSHPFLSTQVSFPYSLICMQRLPPTVSYSAFTHHHQHT